MNLMEKVSYVDLFKTGADLGFDEKRDAFLIKFKHVILVVSESNGYWCGGYVPAALWEEFLNDFDNEKGPYNRLGLFAYRWEKGRCANHDWSCEELIFGARYAAKLNEEADELLKSLF